MPPPPDRGKRATYRRASSSSRPSSAPVLPQTQSSSKSRTSSPATSISSQPNPNAPNPKPLTTLLPPTPSFNPCYATPSRPGKAPTYKVQLKTIDLAKPTDKQKISEMTFRELNARLIRLTTTRTDRTLRCDGRRYLYRQTDLQTKATITFEKINLSPIIPKNIIRQKEEIEQRQKQEQTHSTYTEIAKHVIQQTNPPQHTLTLTNTHQTHSPHNRSTYSSRQKKIGDVLTQSLKLNFNIDSTFPDRDSTAIFNFYNGKTDLQQPQTTQIAPQEEHTIEQTIDTAMDETDAATYTEIRQK
ncbi:hypothetical protein FHG87_023053 [Trinorchestia longiramus]|nr:hypothetical protein FHG87_023053 [Trinorchestia longiramus]